MAFNKVDLRASMGKIGVKPTHDDVPRRDIPRPKIKSIGLGTTRDLRNLAIVRRWMTQCATEHKSCQKLAEELTRGKKHIAARFISVDKRYQLRFIESDQKELFLQYRYATLTHRWGVGNWLRLSRANKLELQRKIPLLSLPPTIRDAVRLCQLLDIPYLWVDTLCITQDDEDEKEREISNMGHIYEGAYINLGALAAAETATEHSKVGLFVDRTEYAKSKNPILTRVRRQNYDELCSMFGHDPNQNRPSLNESTLMSRGWVLQERLLSVRSIYFDKELSWECSELLATEFDSEGLPCEDMARRLPYIWGLSSPFRIGSLLQDSHSMTRLPGVFQDNRGRRYWASRYQCWMRIVEIFSKCNLTFMSDRLLAVSGLAKRFAQEFNDEYLAGSWKNNLFIELLWYRAEQPDNIGSAGNHSEIYIAPSWSWASRTFGVSLIFNTLDFVYHDFVRTAHILESSITLAGPDPTGNASDGYIRISGFMRKTNPSTSRWPSKRPSWGFEWYDVGYDQNGSRNVGDTYHFLMGYKPYRLNSNRPHWQELKVGLILELVAGDTPTYKRVGMFAHPVPNHEPSSNAPRPGLGGAMEFAGPLPSERERQTVTIT